MKTRHPTLSRRDLVRGSLLGLSAACVGGLSGCASMGGGPPHNVPKLVALYQDFPNGRERCGRCVHFRPPNGCEIVAGRISPKGWCHYFKAA